MTEQSHEEQLVQTAQFTTSQKTWKNSTDHQ